MFIGGYHVYRDGIEIVSYGFIIKKSKNSLIRHMLKEIRKNCIINDRYDYFYGDRSNGDIRSGCKAHLVKGVFHG